MFVWRITRLPHSKDVLSGKGGLYASGRWHTKGKPIVYCSESLALATLEYLVNVDIDLVPGDLVSVKIEIPTRVKIDVTDPKDLPRNWDTLPIPPDTRDNGDKWLDACKYAVRSLPSSVVKQERNYLLNPLHRQAKQIVLAEIAPYSLDDRILDKLGAPD